MKKIFSYSISTISEIDVKISIDSSFSIEKINEIIEKSVISYLLTNSQGNLIKGTEEYGGVKTFIQTRQSKDFPFAIFCFDNNTKHDFISKVELKSMSRLSFLNEKNSSRFEVRQVKPSEKQVILIRKHDFNSKIEYSISTSLLLNAQELMRLVNEKGKEEGLDKEGLLKVKSYAYDCGYGLVLLNNNSKDVKVLFKFGLSNLTVEGYDSEKVEVSIRKNSSQFIHLKAVDVFSEFGYRYSSTVL
jgi:hypothetical protein